MLKVIKNRYIYYIVSWVFLLFSLFSLFFIRLNLGIDMTWGVQIEYSYETENLSIDVLRDSTDALAKDYSDFVNTTQVYKISWEKRFSVLAWFYGDKQEKELEEAKVSFKDSLLTELQKVDATIQEEQYINVGKSFGDYIKNTAFLTIGIALFGIAFYVARAFSWVASGINVFSFASITLGTLFHDVLIASGLYVFISVFFKEFQIDTFFITALLTILGYSINDTIVVLDRIRSDLKEAVKKKKVDLKEVIDGAINETLTRSIYTSLTLFLVLIAVFFFGPESIKGFILVMIFGTLVGTYSSIFIAAPLLYDFNKRKELKVIEKKAYNPDDKIVV